MPCTFTPDDERYDQDLEQKSPHFNDPEYYRRRAEGSHVLAEQMISEHNKKIMLKLADDYDEFVVRAAKRSIDETKGS